MDKNSEAALRQSVEEELLRQRDPAAYRALTDKRAAAAAAAAEEVRQAQVAEENRRRQEAEAIEAAERRENQRIRAREEAKDEHARIPTIVAITDAANALVNGAAQALADAQASFAADTDPDLQALFDHWLAIRTASALLANARHVGGARVGAMMGRDTPPHPTDELAGWTFAIAVEESLTRRLVEPIAHLHTTVSAASTAAQEKALAEFEAQHAAPKAARPKRATESTAA